MFTSHRAVIAIQHSISYKNINTVHTVHMYYIWLYRTNLQPKVKIYLSFWFKFFKTIFHTTRDFSPYQINFIKKHFLCLLYEFNSIQFNNLLFQSKIIQSRNIIVWSTSKILLDSSYQDVIVSHHFGHWILLDGLMKIEVSSN